MKYQMLLFFLAYVTLMVDAALIRFLGYPISATIVGVVSFVPLICLALLFADIIRDRKIK